MTEHTLSLILSVALPVLPLAASLLLLRRIMGSEGNRMLSIAASALIFGFSSLWLTKSITQLTSDKPVRLAEWTAMNINEGPYLCMSFLILVGGVWVVLGLQRRAEKRRLLK